MPIIWDRMNEMLETRAKELSKNEVKGPVIVAGGYYQTRDGRIVGSVVASQTQGLWVWAAKMPEGWLHWKSDGSFQLKGTSPHDIVREAPAELVGQIKKARDMANVNGAFPPEDETKDKVAEMPEPEPLPEPPMTKLRLLDLAKEAIGGERQTNYGRPEDNFARIAEHWSVFMLNKGHEVRISAEDVAIMMALMKLARLENNSGHRDSWIDLAGYAACGAEVALRDPEWYAPWYGGSCPVLPSQRVQTRHRGGAITVSEAGSLRWFLRNDPEDIIGWRVV